MSDALERDLRAIYGAYLYLREHDLSAVSTTSRLLRSGDLRALAQRAREEAGELRGALAGTHGHGGGRDDIVLEAYQTLYWLIALAVAAGDRYDDLRPHEVLAPEQAAGAASEASRDWLSLEPDWSDPPLRRQALRAGFADVAACCRAAGVAPAEPLSRDAAELRAKLYLAPYWSRHGGQP